MAEIDLTEVVDKLTKAAEANGLTYERFVELGRADELVNPELRDLWLIWGDLDERPLSVA